MAINEIYINAFLMNKEFCMPPDKSHSDNEKGEKIGKLKITLKRHLESRAEAHDMTLSDPLKATIVEEVLHQTHSPGRAKDIIKHLIAAQEKLPSLGDPELRQERIAHAAELFREREPDFRIKADTHSSRVLSGEAGGSRGFERK